MFESVVYLLCFATAALCAWLLLNSYVSVRQRLLLWSGLCFALLSLNSLLVFLDIIIFTDIDLRPLRQFTTLAAIFVLIYGFVWELD